MHIALAMWLHGSRYWLHPLHLLSLCKTKIVFVCCPRPQTRRMVLDAKSNGAGCTECQSAYIFILTVSARSVSGVRCEVEWVWVHRFLCHSKSISNCDCFALLINESHPQGDRPLHCFISTAVTNTRVTAGQPITQMLIYDCVIHPTGDIWSIRVINAIYVKVKHFLEEDIDIKSIKLLSVKDESQRFAIS